MRLSILSRSAIAVATLAVGSAALVAAPAEAATASGITRDQVLTAAASLRAEPAGSGSIFLGGTYSPATNRALRVLVNRACAIDPDGPEFSIGSLSAATAGGGSADGVIVSAILLNADQATDGIEQGRACTFGALATTAVRSVLTGTASLTGAAPSALSGDVFVTPPRFEGLEAFFATEAPPTFAASGAAVQSNDVKVADKKTKKEKKAAKNKYDSRLKAAKKSYTKALDKAGSSKSKKKAATKAYSAKKKAAKAKYTYAIANYKIVVKKTATPFSLSAQYVPPTSPPLPLS